MDIWEILTSMSTWSILCFIVGFALVIFEMFNPGFGIPGAAGIILLIVGILITAKTVEQGLWMGLILLVVLAILLSIVLYSASKGRLSRSLILRQSTDRESGFSGTEDMQYLLGKVGIALTALRPAGCADLEGMRLDVVSQGPFIEKGAAITVIEVEGNRIVVAPAP